ncbi:hypothetical protein [Bremerella cremea]|uniref:hypothetical protein n=1 Tax=Bremerella cremea TaxID=1031537 RepID=UPI0031EB25B6
MNSPRFRYLALLGIALMGMAVGCSSGNGLQTYPISGTASYGEKPIPRGSITLIPDAQKGNSGAAVSIEIIDGRFDSSSSQRGHVGGPHIARVVGLDGNGDGDLSPKGQMLFPDYEMEIELPETASKQDIVVPGDLKLPKTRTSSGRGA